MFFYYSKNLTWFCWELKYFKINIENYFHIILLMRILRIKKNYKEVKCLVNYSNKYLRVNVLNVNKIIMVNILW